MIPKVGAAAAAAHGNNFRSFGGGKLPDLLVATSSGDAFTGAKTGHHQDLLALRLAAHQQATAAREKTEEQHARVAR